ncbi:hypothetical protein FO519_005498 [Halicephalobus sp. NKZ332]|nr:hypothetical protein FO519_005498 [Halicephalobus sp. NKZ332]
MKDSVDHEWGDYYLSGKRKDGKKNWLLEAVFQMNQMMPSFSEIFDQETFYVFIILIVIASFVFIYLMTSVFKVKIREHGVHVNRPWRDWKPANAFTSPVSRKLKTEKVEHED